MYPLNIATPLSLNPVKILHYMAKKTAGVIKFKDLKTGTWSWIIQVGPL